MLIGDDGRAWASEHMLLCMAIKQVLVLLLERELV